MTFRLDVRVHEDRLAVDVVGVFHAEPRNVMVVGRKPPAGDGKIMTIGSGFAEMTEVDRARAVGAVEVVPFGPDHMEPNYAIRFLLYHAMEAKSAAYPGWRGALRVDLPSVHLLYPGWGGVPGDERSAFLDEARRYPWFTDLLVNERPCCDRPGFDAGSAARLGSCRGPEGAFLMYA